LFLGYYLLALSVAGCLIIPVSWQNIPVKYPNNMWITGKKSTNPVFFLVPVCPA
jgi:hypothetical protein